MPILRQRVHYFLIHTNTQSHDSEHICLYHFLHFFEFHSINSTAYDNRNSPTTGKYWLIKTFEVLKGIQDNVVLDGTVYLDETYFTKVKSKLTTKDGKKLRGIARNKIGVGVACNETKSIFIITGTSKPSRKSTKEP